MFCGRATDEELTVIRQWVSESAENKEAFYKERALFDALQLSDLQTAKSHIRKLFSVYPLKSEAKRS